MEKTKITKVLLAEPNSTNRVVFTKFFEIPNMFRIILAEPVIIEIVAVKNALELKAKLAEPDSCFDVVLINTDLPDKRVMSFREIGQQIKAQNDKALVIALNSLAFDDRLRRDVFLVNNPEFTEILIVPVRMKDLLKACQRFFS
jgi:CheY-like chemotaxis protein